MADFKQTNADWTGLSYGRPVSKPDSPGVFVWRVPICSPQFLNKKPENRILTANDKLDSYLLTLRVATVVVRNSTRDRIRR